MKTNLVLIILVLFFSISISLPILKPGLYAIHDDQHVARLYLFDQSLRAGQFPVRWSDELGFGFGYPLFNFYPPFTYMLGEIFHLAGLSLISSVKIVFFLGIFLSGVSIYILVKELFGKLEGFVAAIFYMFAPYKALDIYVRGALAETFTFVWLPLILWSFLKLQKTGKIIYLLTSSLFLALLMITHNLIFLPFMLFLPIYLIFLFLKTSDKKLFTVNCLLSIVYSLLLSAFFWTPSLFEKKFTLVDDLLLTDFANYRIHFGYPTQLWNWTWGFGGSAPGLADGISFKIGKLHILASIAALIFALIHLAKNKIGAKINSQMLARRSFPDPRSLSVVCSKVGSTVNCSPRVAGEAGQLSTVFFALFLFSAFMTTFYSKVIWEILKPLAYLQFPWRFLTFTALFSSILAGAFIYFLRFSIFKLIVSILLITLLLLGNLKLFAPNGYRLSLTDSQATSEQIIKWDVSKSSFEYIPRGIQVETDGLGKRVPPIKNQQIPTSTIENNPHVQILELNTKPTKIEFSASILQPTNVLVNTFNFPGWQVKVDGQKVPINDQNKLKLISFNIDKGPHSVLIEFENTKVRSFANYITLASLVSMLILFFMAKKLTTYG